MTRIIIALALVLAVLPAHAALNVFACEPEWASLAREIGGDKVDIFSATTAQQDPHHIDARPSLIAKLRRADILVCTGSDLEAGWLPPLLRQAGNSKVQPGQPGFVAASEQVERLEIPQSVDRSQGDVHAAGNPHVHLDPHRLLPIADVLARQLTTLDTADSAFYAARLAEFRTRLAQAIARWEQQAQPLKGMKVVTHHRDYVYLFAWLGIDAVGELESKPGIPPSATHLATLKAQLAKQPARAIVRSSYQDEKPSQWLADQTQMPVVVLPYTVGGSEQAKDLFGLFDDTIARLLGVLK
jgi:zinc/manganese transport system substrate-binding protein